MILPTLSQNGRLGRSGGDSRALSAWRGDLSAWRNRLDAMRYVCDMRRRTKLAAPVRSGTIGQSPDSKPVSAKAQGGNSSRTVVRLAVIPGHLTASCRFKSCPLNAVDVQCVI